MSVKSERVTTPALISLRQARAIREMLKLGSFTSLQIANATNEDERYIQNLICDETSILKRLNFLIPVESVKLGRAGAPAKVWAIAPEKQEEILERLSTHYGDLENERRAKVRPEESTYMFVCRTPQVPGETDQRAYSATISIQKKGDSVEVCAPVIDTLADSTAAQGTAILVDTGKIAAGLAALCQTRATSGQNVTAVVNLRAGEAHFVFLGKASLSCFSLRSFSTNMLIHGMAPQN